MKRVAVFVTLLTAFGITGGCKKAERTAPATAEKAPPAPAVAPAADPWTKPAPVKDPLKRPIFFSVEKDGKTSYLLGTIHMGVDAELRLPQIVLDKLDAAPTFAMETDLSDTRVQDIMKCASGCSLKKQLSEKQWKTLVAELGEGIANGVERMQPMVAATMVTMNWMPKTAAMDSVLLARAQRQKKKIVYLEDAAAAAKVLGKWMDLRALKMMLDDVEGGKASSKGMLEAYLSGEETKLMEHFTGEKEKSIAAGFTEAEYEQSVRDILYDRNAAWIPAIEALHAGGGGFIAVGALHLAGPNSVREMLEKKGYKVTRVVP